MGPRGLGYRPFVLKQRGKKHLPRRSIVWLSNGSLRRTAAPYGRSGGDDYPLPEPNAPQGAAVAQSIGTGQPQPTCSADRSRLSSPHTH
eukprot:7377331-Prymnesium_polylepis.1